MSAAPRVRGVASPHTPAALKDEWLTPPFILSALGGFDLDPCAPVRRPWNTATRHFTVEDDGLSLPWAGRVFCNPPYGTATGAWLQKCATHGNAIALIFARTETATWEEHVWGRASGILFLFGRLKFHHVDGARARYNCGAPSALVAFDSLNAEWLANSKLRGHFVLLQK